MTFKVKAIFDGKVFLPLNPVKLPAGTQVELTVLALPKKKKGAQSSLLRKVASMNLEGPADWSENLDDYLYRGKPLAAEGIHSAPANLIVSSHKTRKTRSR